MDVTEDHIKAMTWQRPGRIPVKAGLLPSTWMKHREALDEIVARHPLLFGPPRREKRDYDKISNEKYLLGDHVDAWGCVWSNVKQGMTSLVTRHPVPTREAVRRLKAPEKDEGLPHGFMFLRLADLRGFEELMVDFAEEPPELQALIDVVLAYNLRQARLKLAGIARPREVIYFGDDLGMQHALPISPPRWRKYLKPCFQRIYRPFRDAGHYVYMHSDGHMWEIIPDLIECGVNVVNAQLSANGPDNLAAVCKGKVCVDLDLNRQMFPFWSPREIDAHIREAVEKLGAPEGGLWLEAEVADDVPLENIEAICAALERYSAYYS
jgi:hypothetical protein